MHFPLFSSGLHGNNPGVRALWQALYDGGTELVLTGHDHDYERFAPQNPAGAVDPASGIREFVVGTGGMQSYTLGIRQANSEVLETNVVGVLQLVLGPAGYDWMFLPAGDTTFTDSGSASCHGPAGSGTSDSATAFTQTPPMGSSALVLPRTTTSRRRRIRRRPLGPQAAVAVQGD